MKNFNLCAVLSSTTNGKIEMLTELHLPFSTEVVEIRTLDCIKWLSNRIDRILSSSTEVHRSNVLL